MLLFASFNDSLVRTMTYPWFSFAGVVAPEASSAAVFPESKTVRYPTVRGRDVEAGSNAREGNFQYPIQVRLIWRLASS